MLVDDLHRKGAASVQDSSMRSGTITPTVSHIKQKKKRLGLSAEESSQKSNNRDLHRPKREKGHP